MITDSDIKKLKTVFATKDELKDGLKKLEARLINNVVEFKDEVLHEIIKLREDMIIVSGHRDMLEDHDQRIEKLEKTVMIH